MSVWMREVVGAGANLDFFAEKVASHDLMHCTAVLSQQYLPSVHNEARAVLTGKCLVAKVPLACPVIISHHAGHRYKF